MKPIAIIIAALLGTTSVSPAAAADIVAGPNSWLVGDWVLCKNPDKSSKDAMHFAPDGTGQVISAKGSTELVYRVRGDRLEMLANAKSYAIPITLTIRPKRDVLENHDEDTGSVTTYVRKDGPRVAECDA
ncbi:hypothetical protein IB223_13590 [Pseudoxanthomonas sp. PXM03]|uniref:hypothetical protein n=1 Tax=Pseudoxanthomonas sp. PXM03 TaxID=2769284 RepID=UPI001781EDD0|nr:hypothetical protein [Pseudoxanthomonas sp. PXM03]MBD9437131.1 hypothetical protein [Pseudoxanthomonas sp. PXM03]